MIHSSGSELWLGLVALVLALAPVGCADARGRFEDFQDRLKQSDAGRDGPDAESDTCSPPPPGAISGPALLALDTTFSVGHPILLLGMLETPELDGTTAVHFVYHALDSLDRKTIVGEELEVGPYALEGGKLAAKVPESTLDGDANPILHGAPITSEMTLLGSICGLRPYYCGTLVGSTSGLISGPFTGHFAITLLDGPNAVPRAPRFGCGAGDFAPRLPDQ